MSRLAVSGSTAWREGETERGGWTRRYVFDFALTADEVATIDAIDTGVRGGPDPDAVGPGDFSQLIVSE
ncbi:hypothetical protein [Streptomyces sp. NPDC057617]|uniref:hypothetical protein n=1 Tax=Streptomyces sp. NPDC057617 TaxID=3346184 RepID=UPI00369DD2DE